MSNTKDDNSKDPGTTSREEAVFESLYGEMLKRYYEDDYDTGNRLAHSLLSHSKLPSKFRAGCYFYLGMGEEDFAKYARLAVEAYLQEIDGCEDLDGPWGQHLQQQLQSSKEILQKHELWLEEKRKGEQEVEEEERKGEQVVEEEESTPGQDNAEVK